MYSEEIEKELPKNSEMIYFGRYFWENSYIAQWLHSKTTFKPDYFIKITKNLSYKEIDNTKNYSINCMLFKKEFWKEVGNAILEKKYDEEKFERLYSTKLLKNLSKYENKSKTIDCLTIINGEDTLEGYKVQKGTTIVIEPNESIDLNNLDCIVSRPIIKGEN